MRHEPNIVREADTYESKDPGDPPESRTVVKQNKSTGIQIEKNRVSTYILQILY